MDEDSAVNGCETVPSRRRTNEHLSIYVINGSMCVCDEPSMYVCSLHAPHLLAQTERKNRAQYSTVGRDPQQPTYSFFLSTLEGKHN